MEAASKARIAGFGAFAPEEEEVVICGNWQVKNERMDPKLGAMALVLVTCG